MIEAPDTTTITTDQFKTHFQKTGQVQKKPEEIDETVQWIEL